MPTMLSSIFSKDKDPHSQSRRKEYEFFDSSPIGTGGYSEVRLARWHPKTFPSTVEEWFAQQDKWAAQHPGEEHGEKIVPKGDRKGKEGLVVAVKVVKKEAVRNNPEFQDSAQVCVRAIRLFWVCQFQADGRHRLSYRGFGKIKQHDHVCECIAVVTKSE
jgi:serine/threonine protein kinase